MKKFVSTTMEEFASTPMKKFVVLYVLCSIFQHLAAHNMDVSCTEDEDCLAVNAGVKQNDMGAVLNALKDYCNSCEKDGKGSVRDCFMNQLNKCWDVYKNGEIAVDFWNLYGRHMEWTCLNLQKSDNCAKPRCLVSNSMSVEDLKSKIETHCEHEKEVTCKQQCVFDQLSYCYNKFPSLSGYEKKLEKAHDCYCNILEVNFGLLGDTFEILLRQEKNKYKRSIDSCEVENFKPQLNLLDEMELGRRRGTRCYTRIGECIAEFNQKV